MPLAVLGDALSIRRKEEGGILDAAPTADGKRPRRERHAVRSGKVGESFDQRGVAGKDMLFEMMKIIADCPQLGEHEEIALFCCFFHHGKSTADISLHVTGSGRMEYSLKNQKHRAKSKNQPYKKDCEVILHSLS